MSTFYMPARVFEEEGAVLNHAGDLAAMGRKALLVTGRRSARANGSYDDVVKALESKGVSHVLFDEIEENPSTHTIMKARDFGVSEGVDFVIGIGGGSPMDAAKAISLMICHKGEGVDYLYRAGADDSVLPIVCVPTTCGTGSEVTPVSVLTIPEKQTKKSIPFKIFADLALIDGRYLASCSPRVLHNTAFDALTHLIESYLNSKASDYSRMCVDAGLRVWSRSLPVIRGERTAGPEDYANMMRASMMAGMAIAHTATTLPHGLSYSVTTKLHVPHGKATAYFTAGYLSEAPEKARSYLLQTAGFTDLADFRTVYHRACGEIEAEEGLLKEVLQGAVEELSSNPVKLGLAPFPVDREKLEKIAFYELTHA